MEIIVKFKIVQYDSCYTLNKSLESLTSIDEALSKILRHIRPIFEFELVDLERAEGRVLAEDVFSPVNIPSAPSAALDGFAIRSDDTSGASPSSPVLLEIRNGKRYLEGGEAVEIATGEPIPKGADAVVPYEKCDVADGKIRIYYPVPKNKNIYAVGEKVQKGSLLLRKGRALKPYDLHVLAMIGFRSAKVLRKPRIGLLSTGSELKDLEEYSGTVGENAVPNSSRFMLEGLLRRYSVDVNYMGIIEDDLAKISKFLRIGIEKFDMVITTGGTALGRRDHVVKAIRMLGPSLLIHGLRIRPGKPTAIALVKGKPVVMLPGVPEATYIGFELIARPILLKILGRNDLPRPSIKGKLVKGIRPSKFMRAIRASVMEKDGDILIEPYSMVGDGLLMVPENTGFVENDEVEVVLLTDSLERSD